MKVLLFSFFLTGLSLVASEDSIDSGNSRIAQRIFSDLTKCQSEIIVVNSSLVAVEKDEEAAYNYLQFLYQQAASEPMRPISLAYATNLLDGYKQIARCGIPAESIAIGDQLQESLNVLEKGGLSINNFFYRNLSIPEMHACKAVHDICFQHKININEGFCDSISGVHVRIQQLLYQKINLEQQKVRLLESLQVYHKIMTDIESDKLTSSSDVSSSLHSENKGNFVENVQNNSKQSAAIQIQALYRMSRAKHISQVAAQDICQNIAKALLYEILDGVDQSIHKKNQEKKEAYDILCRQMQAGIDKKDLEKKIVHPILQSILDKTFVLVDQREAYNLLQSQKTATSKVKVTKKKNKSHTLSAIQPKTNEADEIVDTLVAQNKAQEEFQNIWITNIDMKLTELINNYKATHSEIKGEGLASIVLRAIDQLEITGLDSTRVAASFVKASISMNANLAKLHLDEDAKIAWLKDHQQKNFAFIMNHFDPNKTICHEYHLFHLSTLLSYLISFVDHALEVDIK